VFELVSQSGKWSEKVLFALDGNIAPFGLEPIGDRLAIDAHGNLYGTTYAGGFQPVGTVFELANNAGSYTFSTLHNFCTEGNCADGGSPAGGVILDRSGNLYGPTSSGGALGTGAGIIFKLTP
jgi:uncharacterized repeat protein (TIGR03803 family)